MAYCEIELVGGGAEHEEGRHPGPAHEDHVLGALGLQAEGGLAEADVDVVDRLGLDPVRVDRADAGLLEPGLEDVLDLPAGAGVLDGDDAHRGALGVVEVGLRGEGLQQSGGEVVVDRERRRPQVGRQLLVRLLVLRDERGVEHEGAGLGVAGAGVGLELAGEDDGEDLLVLGELLAERLFGLRGVVGGLEDHDDRLDLLAAEAALGVGRVDERLDLGLAVALVGGGEAERGRDGAEVGDDEADLDRAVGDARDRQVAAAAAGRAGEDPVDGGAEAAGEGEAGGRQPGGRGQAAAHTGCHHGGALLLSLADARVSPTGTVLRSAPSLGSRSWGVNGCRSFEALSCSTTHRYGPLNGTGGRGTPRPFTASDHAIWGTVPGIRCHTLGSVPRVEGCSMASRTTGRGWGSRWTRGLAAVGALGVALAGAIVPLASPASAADNGSWSVFPSSTVEGSPTKREFFVDRDQGGPGRQRRRHHRQRERRVPDPRALRPRRDQHRVRRRLRPARPREGERRRRRLDHPVQGQGRARTRTPRRVCPSR